MMNIFIVICAIACFGGLSVAAYMTMRRDIYRSDDDDTRNKKVQFNAKLKPVIGSVFGVLSALSVVFLFITIVPASNSGVIVTFGSVSDRVLTEGIHFVNPFARVHKITAELQTAYIKKSDSSSKDLQTVTSDITVNYYVDVSKARSLYVQNPNLQYESQYLAPAIAEVLKAVMSQYTAEELVTRRSEVSDRITSTLRDRVVQYHLIVKDINMTNFQFSKAFDEAIEAKVRATQEAEKAMRDLERVRYEAEQRIVEAKASAEAIKIQTAAINTGGGKNYVALEAIKKWDGNLPQYMGGNAPVPFITVDSK